MDIRALAILLAFFLVLGALMVVGTIVVHGLIWLLEWSDPARPLQAKATARVRAMEALLGAIRLGLIRIPTVFRRPNV
jgi:cytochrome bd-type quinol oxidase subunit 2